MGGNVTARPLPVLVSLSRMPPRYGLALATTDNRPASTSTERQRKAQISPRRSSAQNAEQDWNEYRRTARRLNHLGGGVGVHGAHFFACHPGRLHQGGGIVTNRTPHARLRKRLF